MKRGSYTGRLTFDPDTLYHTDTEGRKVVTDDQGKSWRYAAKEDTPHNSRYELRTLMLEGTANQADPEPHHYQPAESDPHFVEGATNDRGQVTHTVLQSDEDKIGYLNRRVTETVEVPRLIGRKTTTKQVATDEVERGDPTGTSHTDSWKEQE